MVDKQEELVEISMQIILHAGNARTHCTDAVQCAYQGDGAQADALLQEAKEEIVLAHNAQTSVIQQEAQGAKYDLPVLFIHAQDTLMTIMSELNMSRELIRLYKYIQLHSAAEK
ncbi:PTS lactose/cellobiose transporter subunit IIA [Lacticaseibacillus daqingensis]|uniref:PTS lactose/cellobiose transporter subunit IIA n=1 Tax=Lacticaseibacillus daqingensis TaxID=2486014 RepID=UPI000F77C81A|nr:PTS lactose/cellobiose transporter subunit IIA [Lacticaseibacillus daqingensis]